jgi:hypothetical protein
MPAVFQGHYLFIDIRFGGIVKPSYPKHFSAPVAYDKFVPKQCGLFDVARSAVFINRFDYDFARL